MSGGNQGGHRGDDPALDLEGGVAFGHKKEKGT